MRPFVGTCASWARPVKPESRSTFSPSAVNVSWVGHGPLAGGAVHALHSVGYAADCGTCKRSTQSALNSVTQSTHATTLLRSVIVPLQSPPQSPPGHSVKLLH